MLKESAGSDTDIFWLIPVTFLVDLRKTARNLGHNIRSAGRDLCPGFAKYEERIYSPIRDVLSIYHPYDL